MVRGARQRVTLNKPISVGFAILEMSKLIMYQFYYDYLKPKYGDNCTLLFTDTDSFCCHIQTDDICQHMAENASLFYTSNLSPLTPSIPRQTIACSVSLKAKLCPLLLANLSACVRKCIPFTYRSTKKQSKIRAKGIK